MQVAVAYQLVCNDGGYNYNPIFKYTTEIII